MAQAKHTPGPWELCQHLKGMAEDQACKCGYRGVIFGPEHDVAMAVCQPGHELPRRKEEWGSEPSRYPREVELANARLIAAAPCLLDACLAFLKYHDAEEGENAGVEMMLNYDAALHLTREAVAKATAA